MDLISPIVDDTKIIVQIDSKNDNFDKLRIQNKP